MVTELENMIPWEREVYVGLLTNILGKSKRQQREMEGNGRRTHGRGTGSKKS